MKIRNILLVLILFLLMSGCACADQNAYQKYKTITIDHTKVASDLANFPMLIVINNDTDIGALANPKGIDINFFSSNGDQLAFERENFSISNGVCNANIWVKIPFLSNTTNTKLYLYYGNPSAIDAQNTSAVWDDGGSHNYSLVQHLDSDPVSSSPQFIDSTSFQYNGTAFGGMTSSNLVSGKINNSIYFNGNGNYIQFDYPSKFDKSIYNPMISNAQFGSMWYSGPGQYDAWYGAPNRTCIMHAKSTDGKNWTSDPTPALLNGGAGAWDSKGVEVPYVWKENSTWYMLFRGRTTIENKIGLATSTDGKNWIKYAGNPVLSSSPSGWELGIGEGFDPWGLIKIGSVYYLWYNTVNPAGDNTRMTGLATSTDLVHWTRDPNNPIFTGGRYCIQEFKYGNYYYMLVPSTAGVIELYRDKNPTFYPGERSYLGYVIATNASSWEPDLLDTPSILSNDIYRNSFPSSNLQMYYTGGTAEYIFKEGLATFPLSMLDTLPKQQGPEITALTMEGWINIPSSALPYAEIATKLNSYGLVLRTVSSNTRLTTEMKTNTPWKYTVTGQTIIPKNSWHHVAATYNATTGTINYYVDGNFDTKDTTSCIGPVSISPNSLWLSTPETNSGVTGREDEIRISNIDRSAGYFKTEYNNQYSPESFSIFGPALGTGAVLPVANFSINVTQGYSLLPVQFNDSSTNATSWSWNFGDGFNSTEQNPMHTYSTAGNYTVNLTVSNANGTDSKSATINIAPQEQPVANFSSAIKSYSVQFTDLSTYATAWYWDFGDGSNSTQQSPSHTYLSKGNYTVSLKASNPYGNSTATRNITIPNTPYPTFEHTQVLTLSSNPGIGYQIPINVTWQNSAKLPMNTSFADLRFDDGVNKLHYWIVPDSVNTGSNCTVYVKLASNSTTLYEHWGNTTALSESDIASTMEIGDEFSGSSLNTSRWTGTATLSGGIAKITAPNSISSKTTFGKGNETIVRTKMNLVGSSAAAVGLFSGNNGVCLNAYTGTPRFQLFTISNGAWHGVDTSTIIDGNWHDARVSYNATSVMVFDSSTISTSIDIPSIALPVSAASESAGSVDIDYLAVRKYSGSDPAITFGAVDPDKPNVPVAGFNVNVTSGIVPLTVKFTDQSTGYPTSWSWNFGDGFNSTEQNSTHTYTNTGNYTVSLTVSNADGNNTTTKTDYITVNTLRPPVAAFSASATSGEAPLTVAFTDTSTGSPTSWSWNFGDGRNSTVQNPVHTYSVAGSYTVSLTVRNANGNNTTTKNDYIIVPITSAASYSTNGLVAYYNFSNDAINGIVVDQSGNGNNLTNYGTSYVYTGNGTYARHLDGSSYLASSNNLTDYRNGFTWEIAYYPTTSIDTSATVMTAGLGWDQYNLKSCYAGGYTGFYGHQGTSWVETKRLTPDYVQNNWITVFIVYNATEHRWYEYQNGNVLGSFFTQTINANNELLNSNLIVGRSGSAEEYFTGNVSYVRVYKRPLTVGEIDYNYMNTKNHYQALQTLNMSKSSGTLKIPVNLKHRVNSTTNVTYSTIDGVAKAGIDYNATSGMLTYLPGETTKYINVQVHDDGTIWQTPKPFYINLTPESNNLLVYNNLTINLINQPGILLTFDDDNLEAWVNSLDQFDKYNAKATFYMSFTYDWNTSRWALCKQLQNDGMEIGAHTEHHDYAPDYVRLHGIQSFIDNEILPNKQDISTNLSDPAIPTAFAYPYGNNISSDTDNAILPYFDTIRKVCNIASPEAFYNFNNNRVLYGMLITDYPMGVDDYRLYTMMDYVSDNGGVLVTFGHNITQDTDYALRMSYARLNNICEYAQTNNLKFYRASDLVTKQPPIANFTSSLTSGTAPLNVSLTDKSIGSPTSWKWNFGDRYNSTEQNPVHNYTNRGNYTVSLTVSNAGGSNTTTKTDYITVLTPPIAAFSVSPTSGEAPLTVAFTDASTGSPTSWSWNFGDGSNSIEQNPVHTFNNVGKYTVKLTAGNSAGSSTVTESKYIKVTSKNKKKISPTSWKWNFVGRNTLTNQDPVIIDSKTGTYTITLTKNNDTGTYNVTLKANNVAGSSKWRKVFQK